MKINGKQLGNHGQIAERRPCKTDYFKHKNRKIEVRSRPRSGLNCITKTKKPDEKSVLRVLQNEQKVYYVYYMYYIF